MSETTTRTGEVPQLSGHWCENCEGVAPGSCMFNPHREADDAVERGAVAPVSVAAGDEVEAVARAVEREYDLADPLDQGYVPAGIPMAQVVLTVLAPYRQAERDAAEERGRRAVMEELLIAMRAHVGDIEHRLGLPAWVPEHLRRLASEGTTTPNGEEGPTA